MLVKIKDKFNYAWHNGFPEVGAVIKYMDISPSPYK